MVNLQLYQTVLDPAQVLHLEVLYNTSVTEGMSFLAAVTERVSHLGHGVDRHPHAEVNSLHC